MPGSATRCQTKFDSVRAAVLAEMQGRAGTGAIDIRRKVSIPYRGSVLDDLPVSGMAQEVELRMMATLKGWAVGLGTLVELNAEKLLAMPLDRDGQPAFINLSQMAKARWASLSSDPSGRRFGRSESKCGGRGTDVDSLAP